MHSRIYPGLIMLVLSLLLVSCGSDSTRSSTTPETVGVLPTVSSSVLSDTNYYACVKEASYKCGISFITQYIETKSDTDICAEFTDISLQVACKEMIIIESAKKTLDASLCKKLTNQRDTCTQGVIIAKGIRYADPSVCVDYMGSSNDSDSPQNLRDRCTIHIIDQLPIYSKTLSMCDLIIDSVAQVACQRRISDKPHRE